MQKNNTIYALSSGKPPAGVAIIRVSGPKASVTLRSIASITPAPRKMFHVKHYHPTSGDLIDDGMVVFFKGPNSYTGEDCAEFHIHGGRATINGLLEALGTLDGLRMAQPGEFTRRAFENGKIDLTKAEAIGDLIAADTVAQRDQALRQLGGHAVKQYEIWRGQLLHAYAMSEADLDFSDEEDVYNNVKQETQNLNNLSGSKAGRGLLEQAEDATQAPPGTRSALKSGKAVSLTDFQDKVIDKLPALTEAQIVPHDLPAVSDLNVSRETIAKSDSLSPSVTAATKNLSALINDIDRHLKDGRRGELIRSGLHVVIAGRPNSGKSSLFNLLAKDDAAIVSNVAGTTRDSLSITLDIDGQAVKLTDTAGLRDSDDVIEQEGVKRSFQKAKQADVLIWLIDGQAPILSPPKDLAPSAELITVWNKTDTKPPPAGFKGVALSSKTGDGLESLIRLIGGYCEQQDDKEPPLITRARHREHLTACRDHLVHYLNGDHDLPELRAEDLRLAADQLGRITGHFDVEEMLGTIFSEFCIGK